MNEPLTLYSHSVEDLIPFATELISYSGNKKIIAFFGEIGAGKTTFIKAICKVLGVKSNVTSPTFSLVNEYTGGLGESIYHFDFYRIQDISEAMDIGCEEYFSSGNYCLIEWPEKIQGLIPENIVSVVITPEINSRKIEIRI